VKYHRYLQARIPGCQLTVIAAAGHWVFWEQSEAFTRTVRTFLDELPVTAGR
jgi:pimeloyl-ACP methyl ester carboxylesterase